MSPEDRSPHRPSPATRAPLEPWTVVAAPPGWPEARSPAAVPGPSTIRLAGPALLVEARFRDLALASKLLYADRPGAFSIGGARGADAPVNPAYVSPRVVGPSSELEPPAFLPVRHRLLESVEGGFSLHLSPAMRAELCTPVQRLAIPPDAGTVASPLLLGPGARLEIPCGEVTFVVTPADPPATLPRRWLSGDWRREARYTGGVALALLALMAVVSFVPADPRALSLDDLAASRRFARYAVVPPEIPPDELDRALEWLRKPGDGGATAAAGPSGKAGDPAARAREGRRAVQGPPAPKDAREAAAAVRRNSLLAVLDGPRSDDVAKVFAEGPVLGGQAAEVLGQLEGPVVANAYAVGGLGPSGTGAFGGGTNERMLAGGGHGTRGRFGDGAGPGSGPAYGDGVGRLRARKAQIPEIIPGITSVRGALDKEIIRRIVRRHLNEVRYCYEQALVRQPSLGGRVVVQFTIAGTGRVLTSLLGSSTVESPAVESCIVQAVRRWEFPEPRGGGLVMVSYPFQLSPAGS